MQDRKRYVPFSMPFGRGPKLVWLVPPYMKACCVDDKQTPTVLISRLIETQPSANQYFHSTPGFLQSTSLPSHCPYAIKKIISSNAMNELFDDFIKAHASRDGYRLAATLSPVAPPNQPQKLNAVWRSTNAHSVKGDIRHFIKSNSGHRGLAHDELTGWVEVFVAYWNAIGEIIAGENGKVSNSTLKTVCIG